MAMSALDTLRAYVERQKRLALSEGDKLEHAAAEAAVKTLVKAM